MPVTQELIRYVTDEGAEIYVELGGGEGSGMYEAGRKAAIVQAQRTFEEALGGIHTVATSALRVLRSGALLPDEIELEFGVQFNVETGVIIASTAVTGQLKVSLKWTPDKQPHQPAPLRDDR
jgi:hypothetical protein